MMRQLIYQALINDAYLQQETGERIYQAGSLGVGSAPANPDRPFILIHQHPSIAYIEVRRTSRATLQTFQVTVHTDRGDYSVIDNILGAVRETILGLIDEVESSTGARCLEARWLGDSQDTVDDQQDTNIRYATFQLTSS